MEVIDTLKKLRDQEAAKSASDSKETDTETDEFSVGGGSPGASSVGTGIQSPTNKGSVMRTPEDQLKESKRRIKNLLT